jgi:hypothetical protein
MNNNESVLWEEKDLIEQLKKSGIKLISVQKTGINEIKNESVKNECVDIGKKKLINEKKTYELFGYTSNQLSVKSNKQVSAICQSCNKDRIIHYSAYRDTCQKCDSGKRITQLNKTRCRTGNKNSFYGKFHSLATKKRLSEIRIANPTHLGIPASHGKHINYTRNDGKVIHFRSSWEHKVAIWLDNNGKLWEYENLTLPITYCYNGVVKRGTLTIDFYLKDTNEIWEIKGWWRDDAKEKYEAVTSQHSSYIFKLLDKRELKRMKIL